MKPLLPILISAHLSAATFYVDSRTGRDTFPGTVSAPFATLARAQAVATHVGDKVLLRRGSAFYETFLFQNNYQVLSWYSTGTGDESLPKPAIDGGGIRRNCVKNAAFTGTVTDGLNLRNTGGGTGAIWECAVGTNTIVRCTVSNAQFDSGVGVGANGYMIVDTCEIRNCKDEGATQHVTSGAYIKDTLFHDNYEAINNSGTAMTLIATDCTFFNNGNGTGGGGDIGGLSYTVALFNRCRFWGRQDGAGFKFTTGGLTNTSFDYCIFDGSSCDSATQPEINCTSPTQFNNCVFYGGGHGKLSVTAFVTATNCIASGWTRFAQINAGAFFTDHCILFNIPAGTYSRQTANTSLIVADPLFSLPTQGDFTLKLGSPAINTGINVGLSYDYGHHPVSNPPERGAYEFTFVNWPTAK